MAADNKSPVRAIIVGAAIALISGGSAPWWLPTVNETLFQSSDWLPSEKYEEVLHGKVREGYYPREVRGSLRNGREVYKGTWAHAPSAPFCFQTRHGLIKSDFEAVDRVFRAKGYLGAASADLHRSAWQRAISSYLDQGWRRVLGRREWLPASRVFRTSCLPSWPSVKVSS